MERVKKIAFLLVKGSELPKLEVSSLLSRKGGKVIFSGDLVIAEAPHTQFHELALVKLVGEVLQIFNNISEINIKLNGTFRVRVKKMVKISEPSPSIERRVAVRIMEVNPGIKVDLKRPTNDLLLIITEEFSVIIRKLYEIDRSWFILKDVFFKPYREGPLDSETSRAILNLLGVTPGSSVLITSNSPQVAHEVIELGASPYLYVDRPKDVHNSLIKAGDVDMFTVLKRIEGSYDFLISEKVNEEVLSLIDSEGFGMWALISQSKLKLNAYQRHLQIKIRGKPINLYVGGHDEDKIPRH